MASIGRVAAASAAVAAVSAALPGVAAARMRTGHGGAALLPVAAIAGLDAADVGAVTRFHLTGAPLRAGAGPAKPAATLARPAAPAAVVGPALAPAPASGAPPSRIAATPPPGMISGVAFAGMALPPLLVDPVLTYQPRRHGPVVEVGVIGGGMPAAADLAHVGMQWRF